jgi:iron uptake system component EfeO
MRRFAFALLLSVAVVGTAVAGFSFAGVLAPKAATVTEITVRATEFQFTLSSSTAPAGEVRFHVINVGADVHDFSIVGQKTPSIAPGGTADLTVTLTAGQYNYLCTIGHHAEDGMQGAFTVTGAAATSTGVTTIVTNGTTQVVTTTQTVTQPTTVPKPTSTVAVKASEFKFTLPTITKKVRVNGKLKLVKVVKPVKHGLIRFVVKNNGKLPHNFVIGGQQTIVLSAGKTGAINVALKKGKYKYICSITGHAALGMKGVLTVT